MRLLLLSNSTKANEDYLAWPQAHIKSFLGDNVKTVLFIPYAVVTKTYDQHTALVAECFNTMGYELKSIHRAKNPVLAIKQAEAIVVSGGNTWKLIDELHRNDLLSIIRERVLRGVPYIGWSAGSNVACPTIRTTNDMPIIEPLSLQGLALIPFQINPHYLDSNPENHAGETRAQRINEYIAVNPDTYVVGLREGALLHLEDNKLLLEGARPLIVFHHKWKQAKEYCSDADLSFLLQDI